MNVPTEFELTVKVLILGDVSVGKTNFISQFTQGKFTENYSPTSSFDFQTKIHKTNGKVIKYQIWDTVGQEKFMSVSQNLLLKVQGIVLMYDITSQDSFEHIEGWLKTIKNCNDNIPIILVANKCDDDNDRIISFKEGEEIATKNNMIFIEASAQKNINVKETFNKLAEKIINNFQKNSGATGDDDIKLDAPLLGKEHIKYLDKSEKKCCKC